MKFNINDVDNNVNDLKSYWNVQTQQITHYEEVSTFTIEKGWLLQSPTITVGVESKHFKSLKNLNVIFSKTCNF